MADFETRLRERVEHVRLERSRGRRVAAEVMARLPEHRESWREQARAFARVAAAIGMAPRRVSVEHRSKKRFGMAWTTVVEHDVLFAEGGVAVTAAGDLVEVEGGEPLPLTGFLDEDGFSYDTLTACVYREDDRPHVEEVVGVRRGPRGLACCVTVSGELVVVCDGGEGQAFLTFERRLAESLQKWA
ncbi:hypothetical protein IOD16_29595 [Saccharothrix sp. 6-C]|uniref:hypothetical protein n=1 Tax=Saccharothrix sp. 6-C TaxID=2781735 RepID=UPI001917833D|nr:hypothetical protein [Saccharothrix sp. 6-C]QQQ75224.1 hypothetical protein IOD16_29595 [Saccharothrix sp. 6-C]